MIEKIRILLINLYIKLYSSLFLNDGFKNNFLNSEQTIDYLIHNNLSIIRWGDGETTFVFGQSLPFQVFDFKLQKDLLNILKQHDTMSDRYLLAMPNYYLRMGNNDLKKIQRNKIWGKTRYIFNKYNIDNYKYGDAFVFRPESLANNCLIEKLWMNKDVIIINSDINNIEQFKDKYGNRVFDIVIPEKDSFDRHTEIVNRVLQIISIESLEINNLVVLISAGPAAKSIVYHLCMHEIVSYDIGQYFKWKFRNSAKNEHIQQW